MKKLKDIDTEDLLSILTVCAGLVSCVLYPEKIHDIFWYTVGGVFLIRLLW